VADAYVSPLNDRCGQRAGVGTPEGIVALGEINKCVMGVREGFHDSLLGIYACLEPARDGAGRELYGHPGPLPGFACFFIADAIGDDGDDGIVVSGEDVRIFGWRFLGRVAAAHRGDGEEGPQVVFGQREGIAGRKARQHVSG
jgi:hypothetical protein